MSIMPPLRSLPNQASSVSGLSVENDNMGLAIPEPEDVSRV